MVCPVWRQRSQSWQVTHCSAFMPLFILKTWFPECPGHLLTLHFQYFRWPQRLVW